MSRVEFWGLKTFIVALETVALPFTAPPDTNENCINIIQSKTMDIDNCFIPLDIDIPLFGVESFFAFNKCINVANLRIRFYFAQFVE